MFRFRLRQNTGHLQPPGCRAYLEPTESVWWLHMSNTAPPNPLAVLEAGEEEKGRKGGKKEKRERDGRDGRKTTNSGLQCGRKPK